MKINRLWIPVIACVFVLGLVIGLASHDGGTVAAKSDSTSQEPQSTLAGVLTASIPVQGQLTTAAGAPLDGVYLIILKLYETSVGGAAICGDTQSVTVTNGLFSTTLEDCPSTNIYGQQLYLGIQVSGDVEMSPRQPIHPVPYALSLMPGAIVNNFNGGRGLDVKSNGIGQVGTSLWVENTNSAIGGIGVWSIVNGTDASIIASNNGTGALFKGFGADGGEDEFRVNNDGSIETKADSYIFISGNSLQKGYSTDTTFWIPTSAGGAQIFKGAGPVGERAIYYPITLPAQLYGQPVKVESITVYYTTSSETGAYITRTKLSRQYNILNSITLILDETDHNSPSSAYYVLPTTGNNVLDPIDGGGLSLVFALNFANDTDFITIGAIRIQLGHHDLY